MGLRRITVLTFLAGCLSLPVVGQMVDNVSFHNGGGTLQGTNINSGTLSLTNSTLTQVSGFTGPFSGFDSTGTNLGTLTFTTGTLTSGTMVPVSTQAQPSTFAPGGSFTVMDSAGFTFTGMFASASWQCATGATCTHAPNTDVWSGTWLLTGVLTNVVLSSNGQQIPINGAISFQSTTFNGTATRPAHSGATGLITFHNAGGGLTNFNVTVMPEPGTLALFGSGLIAMGALVKFSRQGKREL